LRYTASKIGQPQEDAASTAGRHCLLEAKFRELLPCAGFVRLGSEQWPISFTPSSQDGNILEVDDLVFLFTL